MSDTPAHRIEDLAHLSGATVRTIRAYQDRGLLPRPERRGRANIYTDTHLVRLRQIADLLDRGYGLASIKELLEAYDSGRGLGGILGLVAEVDGPWTDEEAVRISRAELDARFGGTPDEAAVAEAVELGVLEPVPGDDGFFLVPSPQELAVAAELYAAGVPLAAISGHLRELRGQVEHIASRFLEFTTEHVFARYLEGTHQPTDTDAAEAASSSDGCGPLHSRPWTPNSRAQCGHWPYDTCGSTSVPARPRVGVRRHVPWLCPRRRCGRWKGWLGRSGRRSSLCWRLNGRCGQGRWMRSRQTDGPQSILTKRADMTGSCPQKRQVACG